MTEAAVAPDQSPPRRRGLLLPLLLSLVLGGGGFASVYLGFWSPAALLGGAPEKKEAAVSTPGVVFVDIPTIEVPVPGGRGRSLILSVSIETDEAGKSTIDHLRPRVSDAYTTFLTGVDPAAYDKRGILEVIRAELVTRARLVLGEAPVKDILITEFRFK